MGYYSNLKVSITKNDYLEMLKKDESNLKVCRYLLDKDDGYVYEYNENGIECVCINKYSIKYYDNFKDIQTFEHYLKQAESGYVFLRIGEGFDDVEYRNTSKYKELEIPFKFIEQIKNQATNEILKKNIHYKETTKQFIILNNDKIIDYCKYNKDLINDIKTWIKDGVQFKLIINVNATEDKSCANIYLRKPEDNNYLLWTSGEVKTDETLEFFGYQNREEFLQDLNKNEIEDDEEFE